MTLSRCCGELSAAAFYFIITIISIEREIIYVIYILL